MSGEFSSRLKKIRRFTILKLMEKSLKEKLIPFSLALAVILVDQITKALVVANIPLYTIGWSFAGDFLRIIHVSNKGVAFSLGSSLSQTFRSLLFSLAPLVVIILVVAIYFRNKDFTRLQRWCVCGIVGGGIGNIIDRIFRPQGVVDFVDVKFYGIFGLERWPTFNFADSAIVVCGILLIVSFVFTAKGGAPQGNAND